MYVALPEVDLVWNYYIILLLVASTLLQFANTLQLDNVNGIAL